MPDPIKRGLRTFLQAFVATFAMLAVPYLQAVIRTAGEANGALVAIDVNLLGNAAIAGVVAGSIALLSFVQNLLEDKSGKALLK